MISLALFKSISKKKKNAIAITEDKYCKKIEKTKPCETHMAPWFDITTWFFSLQPSVWKNIKSL